MSFELFNQANRNRVVLHESADGDIEFVRIRPDERVKKGVRNDEFAYRRFIIAVGALAHYQGRSSAAIFNVIAIGVLALVAVYMLRRPVVIAFYTIKRLLQKRKLKRISRTNITVGASLKDFFKYE